MNEEKQKLQTQIEELEKRISALSKRLKDLGNNQELQTQINQIQSAIEEIGINLDNIITNIGDIQISELNSNINSAMQDIENLETQISTMQTNLANATNIATGVQSQVQTNTTNINKNTSKINSNTNKITNLTTRVTNAENNILALTGGIDVSELLNKVESIEEIKYFDIYMFKNINYGYTPTNKTLYTREHYFSSNKKSACFLKFCLSYTLSENSTICIDLYHDRTLVKTFSINATSGENIYDFEYVLNSEYYTKAIKLKITSSNQITYNSLLLHIFGSNLRFFDCDNEIKVTCYNDYIYITRYYLDCIKYGKFLLTDDIDLNNLPCSVGYFDSICEGSLMTAYSPYVSFSVIDRKFLTATDYFWRECIDNQNYAYPINATSTNEAKRSNIVANGLFSNLIVNYAPACYVYKDQICYYNYFVGNSDSPMSGSILTSNGPWLSYVPVLNYYLKENDPTLLLRKCCLIALHSNGYVYFIDDRENNNIQKLIRGKSFSGFLLSDKSINIYIFDGENTQVFNLKKSGVYGEYRDITKLETIKNCDAVIELPNNKKIEHINNIWEII